MSFHDDADAFLQSLQERVAAAIRDALPSSGITGMEATVKAEARSVVLAVLMKRAGDCVYIPARKKSTPFMVSLREWIVAAVTRALERYAAHAEETAESAATAIVSGLMEEWRGEQFNVPLSHPELDRAIYEEITGGVHASDLACKYRIARSTVYKIYHAERGRRKRAKD